MKIEYEYFSNLIHSCNLNNNRFRLTKELLNIYKTINKNQPANSSNIINSYLKIADENIESLGNSFFELIKSLTLFLINNKFELFDLFN